MYEPVLPRLRHPAILFLGLLLLAKICLEFGLIGYGFTTLLTDEYTHTHKAHKILQHPELLLSTDYRPPLPYILLAASLALYPDLFLAPRILTIFFGLWSVFLMFQLTWTLFSLRAGLVAALLLAFFPWHVWLSATPMQEIFMVTFQLGAAHQFSVFLRTGRRGHLYGMSAYAALANAVHFHAWLFTAVLSVLVVYGEWSGKRKRPLSMLTVLALLWLIPVVWLINVKIVFGHPFYFVQHKIAYDESITLPSGLAAVQLAARALFGHFDLSLWFVPSLFGVAYSLRRLHHWSRAYLLLAGGLLVMSLGLFFAGHHSWRWERQLFPALVLLLPFMAAWLNLFFTPSRTQLLDNTEDTNELRWTIGGVGVLLSVLLLPPVVHYISSRPNILIWSPKFALFATGYFAILLFTVLILLSPRWIVMTHPYVRSGFPSLTARLGYALLIALVTAGSVTSFHYFTHKAREEAVRAGRTMRAILAQNRNLDGNVLLEVTYWTFQPIEILSNVPDRFVYDREIQDLARNNPSLLSELATEEIDQFLAERNIRLAVFRTRELKDILLHRLKAKELAHEGPYTIFVLDRAQAK